MTGQPQSTDVLSGRLEALGDRLSVRKVVPPAACRCPLERLVQGLNEAIYSIPQDPASAAERFRDIAMSLQYGPEDPSRLDLDPHAARVLMVVLDALEDRYGRGGK